MLSSSRPSTGPIWWICWPRRLAADIADILDLGVELKLGTRLGDDLSIEDIESQGYSATYLAIGTQSGSTGGLAGASEIEGVCSAVDFLRESNAGAAFQYRTLFPAMIRDWRRAWGRGDFPFLFVQLANYMPRAAEPVDSGWAELREAQAMTLALPKAGMAVAIDIGEAGDIHPRNKKDVGARHARWALADTYGRDVAKSGPLYRSFAVEGSTIRLRTGDPRELALRNALYAII